MVPQNPDNNGQDLKSTPNTTPTPEPVAPGTTVSSEAPVSPEPAETAASVDVNTTPTTNETPVVTPVPPAKKSPKKLILIIAASLVALLALGGGMAFAVWYSSPQKVLNDSLSNLMNTPPVSGDVTGAVTVDETSFNFTATTSGDGSNNTQSNLKLSVNGGGTAVDINADAITAKNGDLYLRLNDAKKLVDQFTQGSPEVAAMFEGILAKVDSKWVKITSADLKELTGQEKSADTKCVTEAFEAFQKDEAQKKEVRDVYTKNQFITVKEQKADEVVDGRNSFHYVLNTDQAKAKSFASGLEQTQIYKKVKDCLGDSAKDESKYETKTEKDDTATSLEIWVDKSTRRMSKVGVTSSSAENKGNAKISAVLGYNTRSVTLPVTATSIKDLQQEIQDMFSSPTTIQDELDYETSLRTQ